MMDLEQHLRRQIAFSRATFGPGERREMVIDHITKELAEVRDAKSGLTDGGWSCFDASNEWVDVAILALDGLTRSLIASGITYELAPKVAVDLILQKQTRNEQRDWPDWRTAPADKAIEHIKSSSA